MNPKAMKLIMLGHISGLPEEGQRAVKERITQLELFVQDDVGKIALSIVAADLAIKEEENQ